MIFRRVGTLTRMLFLRIHFLSDEKQLTQRELDAVDRLENLQYGWEFPTQVRTIFESESHHGNKRHNIRFSCSSSFAASLCCDCLYLCGHKSHYSSLLSYLLSGCADCLQETNYLRLQSSLRKRWCSVPTRRPTDALLFGMFTAHILGLSVDPQMRLPARLSISLANIDRLRHEFSAQDVRRPAPATEFGVERACGRLSLLEQQQRRSFRQGESPVMKLNSHVRH